MKIKLLLTIALWGFIMNCFGQQNATWEKWNWLAGEWIGAGDGQTGKGSGTFSFTPDLNNKILVRKSHSEYPPTANKPALVHEDLMVIYTDFSGNASRAIYFDNEGHTINYTITYADKSIVLTSDVIPHIPVFRLSYTLLEGGAVNTKFEMSQDGQNFMTYVEGMSTKVK